MHSIDFQARRALYGVQATRHIEHAAQAALPPHSLMQRAGLGVAQLALAIAPHARRIWIACGPGNNGGDGLEAALHLQRWGKHPVVTWLGTPQTTPADARSAHQRAMDAGVVFAPEPPDHYDMGIDALLGIGAQPRPAQGRMAEWIARLNAGATPVLAVDIPTGLDADTGHQAALGVVATHTLSLLTLKPGLFTAHGRDATGAVWLHDLGVSPPTTAPSAWLGGAPMASARAHASHKGSFGDVAVIGGAPGMTGAALLAASAALHAGAGRVFIGLLDAATMGVDTQRPELMFRNLTTLDFSAMTVVGGCGGDAAIASPMPQMLATAPRLVLDADALNCLAGDAALQTQLAARAAHGASTVLTPHPLEAARLLNSSTAQVQSDRLGAAQALARRLNCTVVLKGSGSIIAAPEQTPVINPTGNALLATAGTGDVLAGMVGARMAQGDNAFESACRAVYLHGLTADRWPSGQALVAAELARLQAPR